MPKMKLKATVDVNVDTEAILLELNPIIQDMISAMQLFVDRVDCWEVRSKKTYKQFKDILEKAYGLDVQDFISIEV